MSQVWQWGHDFEERCVQLTASSDSGTAPNLVCWSLNTCPISDPRTAVTSTMMSSLYSAPRVVRDRQNESTRLLSELGTLSVKSSFSHAALRFNELSTQLGPFSPWATERSVWVSDLISFDHFQSGFKVSFITRCPKTLTAPMRAFGIFLASSAAETKFITSIIMGLRSLHLKQRWFDNHCE